MKMNNNESKKQKHENVAILFVYRKVSQKIQDKAAAFYIF